MFACQNAPVELSSSVQMGSWHFKRRHQKDVQKQPKSDAMQRAGGTFRLWLKQSLILIGMRSFPLWSLEGDDPPLIVHKLPQCWSTAN